MTKYWFVALFAAVVSVQVTPQNDYHVFFVCGNKGHVPAHSAATLDLARGLTKRNGCRDWQVHTPRMGGPQMMPNPGAEIWVRRGERARILEQQLTGLKEYSDATAVATTWTQLRPEDPQLQRLRLVVTATAGDRDSKRVRVAVAAESSGPALHGYVTAAGTRTYGGWTDPGPVFAEPGRFVALQRKVQDGTAVYEFDYSLESPDAKDPWQFTLADGPLEGDGGTPSNVYWFYVAEFVGR